MPASSIATTVHDSRGNRRARDELKGRLRFRPASHADIHAFYGSIPAETLKVIAITLDERVAAVIGLARSAYSMRFFSEHKPELVPYLSTVTVWRAVLAALRFVDECPSTVYVVSDDERMMRRLGFEQVTDGVWRN